MPRPDPCSHLAAPFARHDTTIRGQVREELANRQLAAHLPAPPAEITDIGGGTGPNTIRLARDGRHVIVLDPSTQIRRYGDTDPRP